jgi:quercetin dioxygenase-like cupin family protein
MTDADSTVADCLQSASSCAQVVRWLSSKAITARATGRNAVSRLHARPAGFKSAALSTALWVCVATVLPATARATPPIGVTAVTLSKQTVDGKDYIVSEVTISPGGSTGWHTHQGLIYGVIKSGVLTHYGSDCHEDGIYGPGAPITDPSGQEHVHLARNLGTTPLVLEVTYVDPAGAPTSDSAPNPGCDFA